MKFTFDKIKEFAEIGKLYSDFNDNKLSYAIKKVLKRIDKVQVQINEAMEDLRIDNCNVDEKGNVLRDEKGSYQYTKEGLKALGKGMRELKDAEYELEIYIATETPEGLTEEQKEAFKGIVIE